MTPQPCRFGQTNRVARPSMLGGLLAHFDEGGRTQPGAGLIRVAGVLDHLYDQARVAADGLEQFVAAGKVSCCWQRTAAIWSSLSITSCPTCRPAVDVRTDAAARGIDEAWAAQCTYGGVRPAALEVATFVQWRPRRW